MLSQRYVYPTRVLRIERKSRNVRSWKNAQGDVVHETQDLGWFVITEQFDSFSLGFDKPDLAPGTEIKIILEIPCPPSPNTNQQAS